MEQHLEFGELSEERSLAQILYPTKQLFKTFLRGTSKLYYPQIFFEEVKDIQLTNEFLIIMWEVIIKSKIFPQSCIRNPFRTGRFHINGFNYFQAIPKTCDT